MTGPARARRLLGGCLVAAGLLWAACAQAADVSIKLSADGASASTRQRFEDALHRALLGTRYNIVDADKATHRLEVDLRQLGSDYVFRIRILETKSSALIGDRDGRCNRCDETEATGQLELATESLVTATFEAPSGQAPPRPISSGQPAARPTGWAAALPWVGLLGVFSTTAIVHAHYRCGESRAEADACLIPLLGASSLAVLAGGLAVGTSATLASRDPSETERPPLRWAPWVILASGVAAGVSGAELLSEKGYGHDNLKLLGYATAGAGALVTATAIGALVTAPRDRGSNVALHVSPAGVGLSGRF